tara:strand:+ start:8837 stop:9028 length:192 start_codon:yes stop_codon:yes gene_type:complete
MDNERKTFGDWKEEFNNNSPQEAAELTAKFLFAMSYYHDRMKLHVMLHPLFYLAGFITAYALL